VTARPFPICQRAFVLALLNLPRLAAEDPQPAPHTRAPAEPSYDSAASAWKPIKYACTVLSAKNSRAKFVSSFRGGIHTAYVSEVLGHCPLLPGHADLMAYIPEGIQALFVAGDPPDLRNAPRADIRQRLLDGSLPIVVTTWEGPAPGLHYEETAFARKLGDGYEVGRGDENAAAFLRLRVFNVSATDAVVPIRLCINGSNNGQPRGVSAPEYAAPLQAAGDRALNASGHVRLIWRAPPGAKVEPRLRSAAPRVLEWSALDRPPAHCSARAEPPFNRYFASRTEERHDATKAFDGLGMTYWTPGSDLSASPAAIGVEFPERRWLRRVHFRFEAGTGPALDGYRLERRLAGEWRDVTHKLNGRAPGEDAGQNATPAVADVALLTFDPVEAEAFRLVVTKMPEGKSRPSIADASYEYALRADAPAEEWFDTASHYFTNTVRMEVPVAARGYADVVAIVPFTPMSHAEAAWLDGRDFATELDGVAAYWKSILAAGARLEVPEAIVERVWGANVGHIFTSGEIDPTNGLAITMTNVGWYDAVWASLSATEILALDARGLHDDAARYLEPFIRWQGKMSPPGAHHSRDGFLAATDEYTWVRWLSGHGWLLWALSEHFLLSGDRAWLERGLPAILAASAWIEHERATNKVASPDGSRPAHWGLLPPGPTGDGAPHSYSFFGEACAWRGLDAAAAVLREIGHERAAELTRAAADYRDCIVQSLRRASELTRPYALRSGRSVPFVPIDVYNTWKLNTGTNANDKHPWYLDVGPLHAVDLGAVDAQSDLASWMLEVAEDHWLKNSLALDEPWYAPQAGAHLERDEVPRFLDVYYNLLVEGMDRQVFAGVEGHGGVQNLPWADAEHTRLLRRMLIQDEGDTLRIARAVPRAWLAESRRISFRDAPTRFGPMSFTIESHVLDGTISATILPPSRKRVRVELRLRHPQGLPIRGVTVNGKPHAAFEGEWIQLPEGAERLDVQASYGPTS
jgi:hypothetical protein